MPCRSEYMEPNANEKGAAAEIRSQFEEIGDRATASADTLREYLLGNVAAQKILTVVNQPLADEFERLEELNTKNYVKVSEPFLSQVERLVSEYVNVNEIVTHTGKDSLDDELKAEILEVQIEHRKADLARLMKTFAASGDTERLRKVIDADPMEPLTVQLGFSPDEF
jgi:hypothetical protein